MNHCGIVNFDDPRAQTTLEILLNLSRHLQILIPDDTQRVLFPQP
jgi:hypothetical protein